VNDEQTKLARELAAHPKFEWQAGMLARERSPTGNWQPGDYVWRIVDGEPDLSAVTSEGDLHEAPMMPAAFERAIPDLTDDATGGVLWAMAGSPLVVSASTFGSVLLQHASMSTDGGKTAPVFEGGSLAEACARLLLAQWARGVAP
jgi:hypothetical protein